MIGRSKSVMHQQMSLSDTTQTEEGKQSTGEQISPLNFVKFVAWMCVEWGVAENVSVVRLVQEDNIHVKKRTPKPDLVGIAIRSTTFMQPKVPQTTGIVISAHYDTKDHLVEISILRCPIRIPKKVIQVFNLCIPFHPQLTRLSICRGGLNHYVIYEIYRLLPHSNITSICLDDQYVPEGSFYILLQETSQLSYLSLNRCFINDQVCKMIAMNLTIGKPAAKTLRVLELVSNDITDKGANYLGTALRANRCLMHLNLAGNKITDEGAIKLLSSLMEFRLTDDEVLELKRRKLKFLENKEVVYKKCLAELLQTMESAQQSVQAGKSVSTVGRALALKKSKRNTGISTPSLKPEDTAEKMANGIVGEFMDPFSSRNTVIREGCYYAKGNFVLCSLNLAYNNIHYPSLQKLDEIIMYQVITCQSALLTGEGEGEADGLVRLCVDGNLMPEKCEELDRIEFMLRDKHIRKNNQYKKRATTIFSAKSRDKSASRSIQHKKSQVVFEKP